MKTCMLICLLLGIAEVGCLLLPSNLLHSGQNASVVQSIVHSTNLTTKVPNANTSPANLHTAAATTAINRPSSKNLQGCVNDPADIVFLMDTSRSVGVNNFHKGMQFIKEFSQHYSISSKDVQIEVALFSGDVKKQFDLKTYGSNKALEAAIDKVPYAHVTGTHISTAVQYAIDQAFTPATGDRDYAPNFLIFITDGTANPPNFAPNAALINRLHHSNIESFVIGIGSQVSQQQLNAIASGPNHVYNVKSHLDLHIPLRHIRCEPFKTLPPTTRASTTPKLTTITTTTPTTTTSTTPTTTLTTKPTTTKLTTTTIKPTTTTTKPTTTTQTTTIATTTTSTTTKLTTTPATIECMGCKRIAEPHDCEETIRCAEHETCSTDYYLTPEGNVFYDLGCRTKRVCDAIQKFGKRDLDSQKRQDENIYICQDCCNTHHCNRRGCNEQIKLNRTMCASCLDVKHPDECDKVRVCDIDKTCSARHFINDMFEERWTLGCEEKSICEAIQKNSKYAGHPKVRKQVIGGFDSLDLCHYCCNDDFCNKKDCVVNKP